MRRITREFLSIIEDEGARVVSVGLKGGKHRKVRVRAPDGRETMMLLYTGKNTGSRNYLTYRLQVRRFVKGETG